MADPNPSEGGPGSVVAYVGVGSNIRPEVHVPRALALLGRRVSVTGVSTFYRTAPVDAPGTEDFVNGVVRLAWNGDPADLAGVLEDVEAELGRRRTDDRNAPRVIDLDLLLVGGPDTPTGLPPHPDVERRGFVAHPLLELAPELVLPDGRSLADVAADFPRPPGTALPGLTRELREAVRPA